jgi:uncharacterized protein YdcH (DUF465 family)
VIALASLVTPRPFVLDEAVRRSSDQRSKPLPGVFSKVIINSEVPHSQSVKGREARTIQDNTEHLPVDILFPMASHAERPQRVMLDSVESLDHAVQAHVHNIESSEHVAVTEIKRESTGCKVDEHEVILAYERTVIACSPEQDRSMSDEAQR